MAETIFLSSQTFAGRISLFSMNWNAITQDIWLTQTVAEGYDIPFTYVPNQCSSHSAPLLGGLCSIGGRDTVSPAEAGDFLNPIPSEIRAFQDGGPPYSKLC